MASDPSIPRAGNPQRKNFHIHSTFSDGLMSPEQVGDEAISRGLTAIGFAEHFRSVKLPAENSLGPADIKDYSNAVRKLAVERKGRIVIKAGLEIAFSMLMTDFTSLGLGGAHEDVTRHLDFVLFEYVSDPLWAGMDLHELVKIRSLIKTPVGLAHCDIDRVFKGLFPAENLAEILAMHQIFVELCPATRNARNVPVQDAEVRTRLVPYYRVDSEYLDAFFSAAKHHGVLFSIGTDVHSGPEEISAIDDAVEFIQSRELSDLEF